MDPPFNTGRAQARRTLERGRRRRRRPRSASAAGATARGCCRRSATTTRSPTTWDSSSPALRRARELLAPHGTLYFHIDYREAHYCKLLLDEVFGRDAFLNELIWAYDYGAKPRRRWPAKHDTILVYVRTPGRAPLRRRCRRARALHGSGARRAPRRRRGASGPPTSGFTRSCPPTAARRPAIRPRSPRACCGGSSPPRRDRAAGAWIRSPARARSARFAGAGPAVRAGRLQPGGDRRDARAPGPG